MNNKRNTHRINITSRCVEDADWMEVITIRTKRVNRGKKKLVPPVFEIDYDDQHGLHYMTCDIPHEITVDESVTEQRWIFTAMETLLNCDKWNYTKSITEAIQNDVYEYVKKNVK